MAQTQIVTRIEKDFDAGTAVYHFVDGKNLRLSLAELSEAMIRKLALHGYIQKVSDTAAGVSKYCAENGGEPVATALEWMTETREQVKDDIFRAVRQSDGPRATPTGDLADAIIAVAVAAGKPQPDKAALAAKLDGLAKEARAELAKAAPIKAALAQIRADRAKAAASETNTDAILEGIL